MRVAPVAVGVAGACVLLGGLAFFLVPIDDDTCAQAYQDLYHRRGSSSLSRTTPSECWSAMRREEGAAAAIEDAQRSFRRKEVELQAASLREQEEARRVKQLQDQRAAAGRAEDEAGLAAQFRDPLCPKLTQDTQQKYDVSLFAGTDGSFIYTFAVSCPECRYAMEPTITMRFVDGSEFCSGNSQRGNCKEKLAAIQVRLQAHRSATAAALKAWLGCPG